MLTGVLVPVVPGIGPLLVSGASSPALVFVACPVALLLGFGGSNRFGLDGSATWQLVASATDRRDARRDLLGGDLAQALVAVPPVLVAVGVVAAIVGVRHVPAALGLAAAMMATSIGLSGLVAVRAPYVVPDTTNAFGGGSPGAGCSVGAVTGVALLASAALCLPLLGLLIPALSRPPYGVVLLATGPVYGLVLGAVLRTAAARRWATRGPEVLALLTTTRS